MRNIETATIGGKDIYWFEDHATALIAWAHHRRKFPTKPNLITLDCHTDTHSAFIGYILEQAGSDIPDDVEERSLSLCKEINYQDEISVLDGVERLRNDEQIDAAIKADILNSAFVISYYGHLGTQSIEEKAHYDGFQSSYEAGKFIFKNPGEFNIPYQQLNYQVPTNRIFELPVKAGIKIEQEILGDEFLIRHCDAALEKSYLDIKLEIANLMGASIGLTNILQEQYILDIDLDYFRTAKSINPNDPSTFYELIRRATAITIALEPDFVLMEKIQGEAITSDVLFPQLMKHIESALKF